MLLQSRIIRTFCFSCLPIVQHPSFNLKHTLLTFHICLRFTLLYIIIILTLPPSPHPPNPLPNPIKILWTIRFDMNQMDSSIFFFVVNNDQIRPLLDAVPSNGFSEVNVMRAPFNVCWPWEWYHTCVARNARARFIRNALDIVDRPATTYARYES